MQARKSAVDVGRWQHQRHLNLENTLYPRDWIFFIEQFDERFRTCFFFPSTQQKKPFELRHNLCWRIVVWVLFVRCSYCAETRHECSLTRGVHRRENLILESRAHLEVNRGWRPLPLLLCWPKATSEALNARRTAISSFKDKAATRNVFWKAFDERHFNTTTEFVLQRHAVVLSCPEGQHTDSRRPFIFCSRGLRLIWRTSSTKWPQFAGFSPPRSKEPLQHQKFCWETLCSEIAKVVFLNVFFCTLKRSWLCPGPSVLRRWNHHLVLTCTTREVHLRVGGFTGDSSVSWHTDFVFL